MSDKARFSALMDDLGLIYDKDVSVTLKKLYWDDLGHFPIEVIESAMQAHRRDRDRGRFFPKPADLMPVTGSDGRPAPNEAWATALVSMDERASVLMTQDMMDARAVALPVFDEGDKIGARMAFLAAYERIVQQAREYGQPARWFPSFGHDAAGRAQVATEAVKRRLLTSEQASAYLPAPVSQGPAAAIAGLLTGKTNVVEFSGAKASNRLAQLRAALSAGQGSVPTCDAATQREQFERKRKQSLDAVSRMQSPIDGVA